MVALSIARRGDDGLTAFAARDLRTQDTHISRRCSPARIGMGATARLSARYVDANYRSSRRCARGTTPSIDSPARRGTRSARRAEALCFPFLKGDGKKSKAMKLKQPIQTNDYVGPSRTRCSQWCPWPSRGHPICTDGHSGPSSPGDCCDLRRFVQSWDSGRSRSNMTPQNAVARANGNAQGAPDAVPDSPCFFASRSKRGRNCRLTMLL